jgi:hypothetical protein
LHSYLDKIVYYYESIDWPKGDFLLLFKYFIGIAVKRSGNMLTVRGIYDGKHLKLDENVKINSPTEVTLTFLTARQTTDEETIMKRQIKFLEKGFRMGKKSYSGF